jgi:dTDP-4-dehydrorhamnose reductase
MIILSGSHTLLGEYLIPLLRDSYQVCAFDDERGDIRDRSFLEALCCEIKPSVFINCAQMDNVEECEYKREDAYTLNGQVPAHLAEICSANGILLVQMSSHFVFDGRESFPYTEDSKPNPLTVFGDAKDYADKKILASSGDHLIVRLPHLYGRSGGIISHYIGKMRSGEAIPYINDQNASPTYALDAARMIVDLLDKNVRGIVNCANDGVTPLADFLYEVERDYSRFSGRGLVVNMKGYDPDDYLFPCDLPVNNTLDISRLKSLGISPRHWKEALEDFISSNFQYL